MPVTAWVSIAGNAERTALRFHGQFLVSQQWLDCADYSRVLVGSSGIKIIASISVHEWENDKINFYKF
jgi:hypothetical protein